MANAGVRGRPIAPLALSQQERTYLKRQIRRHRVARSLSQRCRAIGVRSFKQRFLFISRAARHRTPTAKDAKAIFAQSCRRAALAGPRAPHVIANAMSGQDNADVRA